MSPSCCPRWLPWLILGPILVGTGAAAGHWLLGPGSGAVWSGPAGKATAIGLPSLAPIVERVKSGVVNIRALGKGDNTDEELSASGGVVTGTGFVIHADGLILTNHHLVADAEHIIVYVPGYLPRFADLVGEDPVTDLVVLRLEDPPEDLTVLELGMSEDLRQGDWVLTLGNPFYRFEHTLTVGVVSYLGRQLPAGDPRVTNDYLQFSSLVNPGSSGSPVLDLEGHVVGVTVRTAVGQGLSFAIPSKRIKWVLDAMETSEDGRVHWGYLGLTLESLSRASLQEGRDIPRGALITQVTGGEPAQKAGLKPMDVVVTFNGHAIRGASDLHGWILCSEPGSTARLEVRRNGQAMAPVDVVIGEVETSSTSSVTH